MWLPLQGLRACPGKLQRRGIKPELRCHKIDLDAVNFVDVLRLKDFMSADGEIMPKKETGLCAKCQRKVSAHTLLFQPQCLMHEHLLDQAYIDV
jgi:ribosomal protein S18